MFLVEVVFEQNGYWSKPYNYLCKRECKDHVVVPTGNYMSVGMVISCKPVDKDPGNLKYIFGPVSYEYLA